MLSAEDRLAIEALHRAWLDAELRGDSQPLLQFCTAAPVWLPPNEAALCGREEILRWLDRQPHVAVLEIDIRDLVISGVDTFELMVANFRTRFKGPGDSGVGVVAGSHAWLLQRDEADVWRVAVVAWTIATGG